MDPLRNGNGTSWGSETSEVSVVDEMNEMSEANEVNVVKYEMNDQREWMKYLVNK